MLRLVFFVFSLFFSMACVANYSYEDAKRLLGPNISDEEARHIFLDIYNTIEIFYEQLNYLANEATGKDIDRAKKNILGLFRKNAIVSVSSLNRTNTIEYPVATYVDRVAKLTRSGPYKQLLIERNDRENLHVSSMSRYIDNGIRLTRISIVVHQDFVGYNGEGAKIYQDMTKKFFEITYAPIVIGDKDSSVERGIKISQINVLETLRL